MNVRLNRELAFRLLNEKFGGQQIGLATRSGVSASTITRALQGKEIARSSYLLIKQAFEQTDDGLLVADEAGAPSASPTGRDRSVPALNSAVIMSTAPPYAPHMFGRQNDLDQICQKIRQAKNKDRAEVIVVYGVPGVGKTSLINHFARNNDLAAEFKDGCYWTAVGQQASISHLLQVWGRSLKVDVASFVRTDDAAAALRAAFDGRQTLLIVDDVWSESQAELFRVAGPNSVILLSTRIPKLINQFALSSEYVYHLVGLKTSDGIELLASIAPNVVVDHQTLCEQLVQSVEGLPLAINVAGRMLNRESEAGEDIPALLSQIRNDARVLMEEQVPPDMSDLLSQTTPDVAAVLRRSTNGLSEADRRYFSMLAVFPMAPQRFTMKFTHKYWKVTHDESKQIAKHLVAAGLLETAGQGYYRIHPLMQALARYEAEKYSD